MKLSEKILAIPTVKKEEIHIKEWDETLFLHELNAKQRDQYGYDASEDPAKFSRGFSVRIIKDTLHDSEGNPVFDDNEMELLAEQSGTLLADIALKSRILSGLSEDAMEEAEKNSESDQSESTYFS